MVVTGADVVVTGAVVATGDPDADAVVVPPATVVLPADTVVVPPVPPVPPEATGTAVVVPPVPPVTPGRKEEFGN